MPPGPAGTIRIDPQTRRDVNRISQERTYSISQLWWNFLLQFVTTVTLYIDNDDDDYDDDNNNNNNCDSDNDDDDDDDGDDDDENAFYDICCMFLR